MARSKDRDSWTPAEHEAHNREWDAEQARKRRAEHDKTIAKAADDARKAFRR